MGQSLFKKINYIFTQIGTLKMWFVTGILMLQKWFDVDVSDFQILSFDVDIRYLLAWRLFGYFFEKIN
jgi:hypothetical protein